MNFYIERWWISLKHINEIKKVGVYTLLPKQVKFLEEVGVIVDNRNPSTEDGIPVYVNIENEMFFIEDYVLKNNKMFENQRKSSPETKLLYRGGGVIIPVVDDQCIAIYDERYGWYKPIGGIAKFEEGTNLELTAIRESIIEELFVCDSSEEFRIIPSMIAGDYLDLAPSPDVNNWALKLNGIVVKGNLETSYTLNDENGAYECVVKWVLPGKPSNYGVFHQEDWFKGGPSGIVPVTLDKTGNITGYWSGRQGYVSLPVQKTHPTLKKFWLDEN